MCEENNGSIYRECREAILRQAGVKRMRNKDMRLVIIESGGCLSVDSKKGAVLVSNQ